MNKIILSCLSFFILVIVALLIIPSFIDWSDYKEQITTQAKDKTGYDLVIGGELRAAFLPMPHVNVEKLSVDSADAKGDIGFKGKVDKASISLALLPLLSGNIAVSDITLINPIVDVVEKPKNKSEKTVDEETIESKEASADEVAQAPLVQIDDITIKGAKISYTPLKGQMTRVEFPELYLQADNLTGPYEFDSRVLYQNFDLAIKGNIGEFDKVKPLSANVTINGGAYDLSFSGVADMTKTIVELQGEIALNAKSVKGVAQQFGTQDLMIKDQSFELKGMINASAKSVSLNNGNLKFGGLKDAMPVTFDFQPTQKTGAITLQNIPGKGAVVLDLNVNKGIQLSGDLKLPSLSKVAVDWLGLVDAKTFDNPQIPNAIEGDIKLSKNDNNVQFSSQHLLLGQYDLKSTSLNYVGGDKPKIDVAIADFSGANIRASGTMDMAQGINVNVSHPNGAKFIQVFQKDFQSSPVTAKSFSFKGLIKNDNSMINVTNMVAKIGNIDASGLLSVDNGGSIPSITADLNFGTLDTQALMSGKMSKASTTTSSSQSSSTSSHKSSGAAPWTRDAIDTSALRAINLDLNAKAKRLVHGTWLVDNPAIKMSINNGVVNVEKINGDMFGGTLDMNATAEAKEAGKPLSVKANINATAVDLSQFVKAATSQTKERVTGKGDLSIDLSTQGVSSSALIYGLNADGKVKTTELVVKGIDFDKVTEALSDESLTDLGMVVQGAFKSGQTKFQAIDHDFIIREGTIPVTDFTLVSTSANLISNGEVSFARWVMNLKNTVDFTNPDDLPSVEMTLKGPLNAPKNNVASDVLKSFVINKYGAKIQKKLDKVLGDKLKGTGADTLINNLLGLPEQKTKTPSNDNTQPTTQEEKPKLEEQLLKGLFNSLGK